MSNKVFIRRFENEDFNACHRLAEEFEAESLAEYGARVTPASTRKLFDRVKDTSFMLFVDDEPAGMLAGAVLESALSGDKVYKEVVWFVSKEYRRYGLKLRQHVEKWCCANDIDRLMMAMMHNSKTKKLEALYKRLGFRPMETRFIKRLSLKSREE